MKLICQIIAWILIKAKIAPNVMEPERERLSDRGKKAKDYLNKIGVFTSIQMNDGAYRYEPMYMILYSDFEKRTAEIVSCAETGDDMWIMAAERISCGDFKMHE